MKILAIDSSACSASVALMDDEKLVSEFFLNAGLTHSQTLMPMVESVLKYANFTVKDIDLFVVTNGPGSFTGVRIGVSAVKGMAQAAERKCIGVSTLEAMAYNLLGMDCIACCVMDARCDQVYTAAFSVKDEKVERIFEDTAMSISDLENILKKYNLSIFLVGDGAELCYNRLNSRLPNVHLTTERMRYQHASSAVLAARGRESVSASELVINYLRIPQAERELKKSK